MKEKLLREADERWNVYDGSTIPKYPPHPPKQELKRGTKEKLLREADER